MLCYSILHILINIVIIIIIIVIIIIIITSTGGMGEECKRYHSRLAELIAAKKGEDYATTVSWIRSKVSFAILRSALICLRGSRTVKRNRNIDIYDMDFQVENSRTAI